MKTQKAVKVTGKCQDCHCPARHDTTTLCSKCSLKRVQAAALSCPGSFAAQYVTGVLEHGDWEKAYRNCAIPAFSIVNLFRWPGMCGRRTVIQNHSLGRLSYE
jgi:hypothetical protein